MLLAPAYHFVHLYKYTLNKELLRTTSRPNIHTSIFIHFKVFLYFERKWAHPEGQAGDTSLPYFFAELVIASQLAKGCKAWGRILLVASLILEVFYEGFVKAQLRQSLAVLERPALSSEASAKPQRTVRNVMNHCLQINNVGIINHCHMEI